MRTTSLSENLKRLRAEKRLSQAALARQAEVSPSICRSLRGPGQSGQAARS